MKQETGNRKRETGNRKRKPAEAIGRGRISSFLFPVSCFLFPVLLLPSCDAGKVGSDAPAQYTAVARLEIPASADTTRGYELFQRYCALCHGAQGDGHGPRRNLVGRPADFRNPAWRERANPDVVFTAVTRGSPGTSMPAFRSLSDAQAWDLTAYVLSLGGASP